MKVTFMQFKIQSPSRNCVSLMALSLVFCILFSLSASASSVLAQGAYPSPLSAVASPAAPRKDSEHNKTKTQFISSKPDWTDLTAQQRLSLKPLADNWNYLEDIQKRKWIALSVNFQTLAPVEQEKLHSRMKDWVSLSQQQRTQARLSYAQSKQIAQSHKAATWQAYQALSQEEKTKLALTEKHKSAPGSATTKSSPRQKLALAPAKLQMQKPVASVVANLVVDRNTLLPHALVPTDSSAAQKH